MLNKKYNASEFENQLYDFWVENDFFKACRYHLKPYTIVIPPPNVTGKLHIGHALDNSLQDIIARYKRMQGYNLLYLPGSDHAGIATQAKIDQKLRMENTNRFEIGREKFLEEAWDWTNKYRKEIHNQWRSLGLSLDYSRERFTLDDGLNKAVNKVFIDYYNKGLIYKDYRIVNFDTKALTALSNIEVYHVDSVSKIYYMLYKFVDSDEYIEIATTRPETCFGDAALMVHPKDKRYQKYIGKKVYIPMTNREIEIISDSYVDMKFGTGVVKVTPAHDPNDFEVSKRHNLEKLLCMNEDATMNELALKYEGMDRFECRDALIKDLEEKGQISKIKDHNNSVGYSERTNTMVEPRLSLQWFIKMDSLSKMALDCDVEFIPKRFFNIYKNWMTDTLDWCISRQLWWGHRIPAWYKDGDMIVSSECPGDGYVQDEDVLDTWFSSALWPFSTLGWPEKTNDLETFFPTDTLVLGYDIIFFWGARMIFQSYENLGQKPFKKLLIHGIIRNEDGTKMSKSSGKTIDPVDVIEKYGMDSLRYYLTTNTANGSDMKYSTQKLESSWAFINKLWNISKYVIDNTSNTEDYFNFELLNMSDKYIIARLNETIKNVNKYYEKFEFSQVSAYLENFIYNDFSSLYVEISKIYLQDEKYSSNTKKILLYLLDNILRLLHPLIPFVTEKIFLEISSQKTIVLADFPINGRIYKKNIKDFEIILDIISKIRNFRSTNNVTSKLNFYIQYDKKIDKIIKSNLIILNKFLKAENIYLNKDVENNNFKVIVLDSLKIFIEDNEVDLDNKIQQLNIQYKMLEGEVKRSENILNNEKFLQKAPEAKIEEEKEKYRSYVKQFEEVKKILNDITGKDK